MAGACGYLLKDSSIQELIAGISARLRGRVAHLPADRRQGSAAAPRAVQGCGCRETIRAELSDRELQVLKLIANGKDNAQIARELFISRRRSRTTSRTSS
jgi:DNA-binding NarL/FixJ family response regulator